MVRSRSVKGPGSARTEGARRATGVRADAAAGGAGALAPGQRWSASRKRDVVLRLLRGESLDAVSREVGVELYRLEAWKERALAGLELGLKDQAGEPAGVSGLGALAVDPLRTAGAGAAPGAGRAGTARADAGPLGRTAAGGRSRGPRSLAVPGRGLSEGARAAADPGRDPCRPDPSDARDASARAALAPPRAPGRSAVPRRDHHHRGASRHVGDRRRAGVRCFRHQLLLPRPYLVLTKPLRLDIQCQRAASVKIGWKYLDD